MDELKKQPGFVVAILATFGLFSLPHIVGMQDGGGPPPGAQEKSASQTRVVSHGNGGETDPDRRDLKPLLDYLDDGDPREAKPAELVKYLRKKLPPASEGKLPALQCLVVTLPDPVASVASARFDEFLDVVQRAIELQGYILDRSLLPWKPEPKGSDASPDRTTGIRIGSFDLGVQFASSTPPQPDRDRPGLLVFKYAFPPTPEAGQALKDPAVLLVFVVPESPISGIEKKVFYRSLELIDQFFNERLNLDRESNQGRRVLHIVAPCFSGSQRSLEIALGGGAKQLRNHYHFRIISNNAGHIDRGRIEGIFAGDPRHGASFRSMVHQTTTVVEATLDYLQQTLGYDHEKVALLIESNTGLAQALAEKVWKKDPANEFIFPLQVSEVRKAYEKEGLLRGGKLDSTAAPERLVIPPDESGPTDDLPRAFTPASSAAIDEMALTQVLTTISHRRYLAVGIVATNPFDLVFLARRVRRFSPNVRLFAIQADLLFARPENAGDLRGMLIGSTYSLYPANQWITTSYGATPRVPFSDHGGQGLYNAVVAHLWEMVIIDAPQGPPLLEFALPYGEEAKVAPTVAAAAPPSDAPPIRQPPIWMSAVGERGIYPVAFDPRVVDRDYLYQPDQFFDAPRSRPRPPSEDKADETQARRAMRPNPHLLYWLIFLLLFLTCFGVAGLTWVYIRWSGDEKKKLDARIGPFGFGHLMRTLNSEVERDTNRKKNSRPPPSGAGINLFLINLIIFGLTCYVYIPFLVAMGPYLSIPLPVAMGPYLSQIMGRFLAGLLTFAPLSAVSIALVLSFLEVACKALRSSRCDKVFRNYRKGVLLLLLILCVVTSVYLFGYLTATVSPSWRLYFERITYLPSGVSPLSTLLFLTGAMFAWIQSRLARRRLYRLSYLPSTLPENLLSDEKLSRSQETLVSMREARATVDSLILYPWRAVKQMTPLLPWGLLLLLALYLIRSITRGMPRSFEGRWFDLPFWAAFSGIVVLIVGRTLQLLALWHEIRFMLQLAVSLPMTQAFDRIPQRLKNWFFGEEDFQLRKRLILRQSIALRKRSTVELAGIFAKLFTDISLPDWKQRLAALQSALESKEGTLESTRSVYLFLDPLWDSLPVEDVPRRPRSGGGEKEVGQEWLASWPLMPKDYDEKAASTDSSRVTPHEHTVVRDWARMAEDLVALQIVRWFAPALAQLLPIMKFLVLGSLCVLLAVSSYPFDHSGWLMTVIVSLIIFVALVVGTVLVGVNRDEMISRVSDTTPGWLSLDSGFVRSFLTMLVPLLGALLAISYDLSDLLNVWFGPLFRLF
jgi:hypothetical protein